MNQIYAVEYLIVNHDKIGSDKIFTANCSVREGYTTFGDIPKMIAIKRDVVTHQVLIIKAILVPHEG